MELIEIGVEKENREEENELPQLIGMDRELIDRINFVNLNFSEEIEDGIVHSVHDFLSDQKLHKINGLDYVLKELKEQRSQYGMEDRDGYPLEKINDHEAIISISRFKNRAEVVVSLCNVYNQEFDLKFEILDEYGDKMLSAPFDIVKTAYPPFFGTERVLYSENKGMYETYVVQAKDYEIKE